MSELTIFSPPIPPDHLGGDGQFANDIATQLSADEVDVTLISLLYNSEEEPSTPNDHLHIIKIPIWDEHAVDRWDMPIWDPKFTSYRDRTILEYLDQHRLLDKRRKIHEIG